MTTNNEDTAAKLAPIAANLAAKYPGTFNEETVSEVVQETYEALAKNATVTAYLPVLTARYARDELNSRSAACLS